MTTAPTRPAPGGVWAPGRRSLTLGLVLTITLVGFEGLAVATVMPVVSKDLGDIGLYGWAFSAFFLGSLVGIVAAGRSADEHGPTRAFVAGLVLFAAGLVAAGSAPSMAALVAARAVQGLGAGAIPAVAYVVIGRAYAPTLQPRMFAWLSTAWVLPGVIGPALSGAVADTVGWRWVFLGLLPLVLVAGGLATPALRTLGPPGGTPDDRRLAAIVLALGAGVVLGGLSVHSAVPTVALVVAGVAIALPAFLRLMPPGTTRLAAGLPAAVAIRGLQTFAFFGTDAFVTLTLESERHVSATMAGLALTGATLTWTAGAWVQERAVRRTGPRRFSRTGMLVITAGIGLMIVVATTSVPVGLAVVAWSIAGFGMGLAYSPLSLVVLDEAAADAVGAATASLQLNDTLGIALGTGVSGAIVAAGASLGWSEGTALATAFALCAVLAIGAAVASRRLPNALAPDPA